MDRIRSFFPSADEYVSEDALKNLRNYKYSAVDKSFLTKYLYRHYWEWAVTLFPRWMAPNLITLTGLSFEVFDVLLVLLLMPDLEGPGPWWLYFAFGIGMWLYSTFDNVDGKQARRTGSSSPLGELFDHGCDALNCTIAGIVEASAFGCGISWRSILVVFMTTMSFFFSTWEEYHTGVLYLGYINGPTEILTIAVLACFASGIWGPQIWHVPASESLPLIGDKFPTSWELIDVMLLLTLAAMLFGHCLVCCWNVYSACKAKNKSFFATLPQLFQYVAFAGSCYLWLSHSTTILADNHLVLFLVTAGTAFGRIVSKIILAHLTEMPFPSYTVQMVPLAVGAGLAWAGLFSAKTELLFLIASCIFVVVAYLHWALVVIERFCEFLGINCLTIRPQPDIERPDPARE
ncbi:sn-1,2-diacylglycerol cholinephosphotransferase [Coemansia reversa NRRL 1564]|uniref:sn-1,2-diacylglycerol cholinephosphotransferase n=1 Tax=Coemansia reversa (strain ATCC 12441 / NRRL 1564) TaxID=763665 RepID=A0A2G5BJX7_COERN|nr:sn-1,2-diacylglycerol cholinephosphotransferase [Coemansia reversa NRRL 1564]|eukprot:PIA19315.1 sn-1,2-diacylglycerol cholinephosphotransferase [Coemansia reversa NRRL 1564]